MEDSENILRQRYPNLHPLLFLRSKEKAKTISELFDILEGYPNECPIIWNEKKRCWVHTDDLLQRKKLRKGE